MMRRLETIFPWNPPKSAYLTLKTHNSRHQSTSMKVTEVAFVGYPVSDVRRARDFYENVLGLTLTLDHELEDMPGKRWVEYDLGNITLAISNTWEPSGQSGPAIALEVDDLDEAVMKLKAAGTRFLADHMESPVCCFALISDPDGNAITIHKRKPSAAH
jgi:predicted enzyme related to lactoylglutathione lyase